MNKARGFTLVEVLIALAITAFVSTIAYSSLSTVMLGAEANEDAARRGYEINRAWMILSRDLEHFVERPVRDEFGELESALVGGPAARFPLSFSRGGWHNPIGAPRSEVQRVNYRLENDVLWRDAYPVLDRADDTEPQSARLLEGVASVSVLFLESEAALQGGVRGTQIETRNWPENWVADPSTPGSLIEPPLALEVRLELEDWGEMRRLYVLPPL
ncbi:type II secretion system protein GspJ [Halioglobus japonicus]|uniref:Type II secretion system protein J n=1 Tax=Halioglobus japonicus TaxID=930805 RepID=A0AAP8MG05_9GAMM|nr:type II secretion system minor pseudopilin GspJ [Halioglobus japonicus]AQA19740.1 type II secretion system protein GspJ [Halioglobus japonicus]PLW87188.1 type II secretion system protein GspJ [Halioglobus japonicus]GHD09759.1 type II secretion system protein J [Halioglobus japonicus]